MNPLPVAAILALERLHSGQRKNQLPVHIMATVSLTMLAQLASTQDREGPS